MEDTRIPYGARCTWWDSIDKVAVVGGIPRCPYCRGVLFEVESEERWLEMARDHEARKTPGYFDMLMWARGKCFPTYDHMKRAYQRRPQRIEHIIPIETTTKRQRRRARGKGTRS